MKYQTGVAAIAMGLALAGCSSSPNSSTATTTTASKTATASVSQATTTASTGGDLKSLIPTPANATRTDGPDAIHDNGIHLHFFVNGSPKDVMSVYKAALEGMQWSVSVQSAGGSGGGGGATITGINGNAYGVFAGGGYGGTTDVDACAWPSQPTNTDCGRGGR
ncbi:hypothetical protein A5744_15190 [Mycobacterium sp. IS-1264]|nr:hypothetical protein A5744_15190 [Mycobacterium sp. IS-1264]